MTEGENFAGQVPPSIIDDEYRNCNFKQPAPVDPGGGVRRGVVIFGADTTPRTFIECNLVNCEPPPGSTVTDCNTAMIEYNVETTLEEQQVNGEVVASIQHHSNFVYGGWTPSGYTDFPTPEEYEID